MHKPKVLNIIGPANNKSGSKTDSNHTATPIRKYAAMQKNKGELLYDESKSIKNC